MLRLGAMALVATIALEGCTTSAVVPAEAERSAETTRIRLAVGRYIMARWKSPRPRYVCVEGADPDASFLAALQPSTVAPLSGCSATPVVPAHPPEELNFVRFNIGRITWQGGYAAVVEASFYCGSLCAGVAEYHCSRDEAGGWRVDRVENEVES